MKNYRVFKKVGRGFIELGTIAVKGDNCADAYKALGRFKDSLVTDNLPYCDDVTAKPNGNIEIGFFDDFAARTIILFKLVLV